MKKLVLLFTALFLGTTSIMASTADDKVAERNAYRYNKSFIFVENGVTFSVYPDGEFDFYIDNRIGNRRRNVTFNSGFDYSAFAQYDDYGAVIQVENVPIYYDDYGRVAQIGDVDLRYRRGRVYSVGNMFVYYNNRGFYDYHTGYINRWNRFYVYRPFHGFFARPALGFCFVNTRPYRRFYSPIRYTFYNPYRFNNRNRFAKIGRVHRYNNVRRERANIYRNDKRVAVRDARRSTRSNRTVTRRTTNNGNRNVTRNTTNRNNRTVASNTTNRSNNRANSRSTTTRNNGNRNRTVSNQRTTTNRQVVKRTPRTTTVKRSTTVRTPSNRGTNRTVRSTTNRTQRSVSRPAQRTSRSTVSRSSASRSSSKASTRSSRSNNSRSTSSRSRGRLQR